MTDSGKIEVVFVGQEGGHDHYEGRVDGRTKLKLDMSSGLELNKVEHAFKMLFEWVYACSPPTQIGKYQRREITGIGDQKGIVDLAFCYPGTSIETTIDFLEQVMEMVRGGPGVRGE